MKISVVIPLFNKRQTIKRAIDSVLAQDFQPMEILVINDGSTDGSEKVVEEYGNPHIRLIHQENAGVSAARNRGVEEAKFEWIAFLDGDDLWISNFLKKIKELHQVFPDASILATNYNYQDFEGKITPTKLKNIEFEGNYGKLENYFQVAAYSSPPIWSSAVVVKKNSLIAIGLFPIGVKSGEDLITWAKLALGNQIAYHKDPLSIFIQEGAHTFQEIPNRIPDSPDFVGLELKRLLVDNKNIKGLRAYLAHWHKMRASIFLRLGMKKDSIKEIFKSLRYESNNYKVWGYLILNIFPKKTVNKIFQKFQAD